MLTVPLDDGCPKLIMHSCIHVSIMHSCIKCLAHGDAQLSSVPGCYLMLHQSINDKMEHGQLQYAKLSQRACSGCRFRAAP